MRPGGHLGGTSFGGGHSLTMAARDHRLAAAIAQCPFTDGLASALAVNPFTSVRVTCAAVRDLIGAARGAAPRYLPSAARPGVPSFMSAYDALPGITALGAEDADFDNRITARSAFDVLFYAPGRHTKDIRCPVYVALCDPDTVAPPNRTAERQTSRASGAEVHTYPVGHFDIYFGEHFDRASPTTWLSSGDTFPSRRSSTDRIRLRNGSFRDCRPAIRT